MTCKLEVTDLEEFLKELKIQKITDAAVAGQYLTRSAQGVPITDFVVVATTWSRENDVLLSFKELIGTAWFDDERKELNKKAYTRAEYIMKTLRKNNIRVIRGFYGRRMKW